MEYYEHHAECFVAETIGVDITDLYRPFLARLPDGGRILDAGCGSGRDTLAFKRMGYSVVSIDASPAMVKATTELTGSPAVLMDFREMEFGNEFDGIWACASLLHVSRAEMDGVWQRFIRALKPGGVWFMSFKAGINEEVRNGRLFNDYEESMLAELIGTHREMKIEELWSTADVRPGRLQELWTNAIVRLVGPAS